MEISFHEHGNLFFAFSNSISMIQRIQTVYLGIATLLTLALLLIEPSLASVIGEAGEYFLTPVNINLTGEAGTAAVQSSFAIAAILSLGLFLSIFAIMKFKDRKLQIKLTQGAVFVQLVAGGVVFFYADQMAKIAGGNPVSYNPILGLLLVNVVLYFLAIRGIKKDEALVRSADRLR